MTAGATNAATEGDRNKAVVARMFKDAWNGGDLGVLDGVLAADFRDHPPRRSHDTPDRGREALAGAIEGFRAGFSDLRHEIVQIIADGSRVVSLSRLTGTHDGTFLGIPASGKPVSILAIDEFELADGRIVGRWGLFDVLGVMGQVGMGPGGPGGPGHG